MECLPSSEVKAPLTQELLKGRDESRKILASLRFVAKTAAPRDQLTQNSASERKLTETDPRSTREGRL